MDRVALACLSRPWLHRKFWEEMPLKHEELQQVCCCKGQVCVEVALKCAEGERKGQEKMGSGKELREIAETTGG